MHTLSRDEYSLLIAQYAAPCVSILLPIQWVLPGRQQNRIRLGNQLRQADEILAERGQQPEARQAILAPIWKLLEDQSFWEQPCNGLAVFVAANFFYVYRSPLVLPELVMVDERFYITPLLPLFSADGEFYVLALSLNHVRLMRCTHYHVAPIALPNVRSSLAGLPQYDESAKQPQPHPGGPAHAGELHQGDRSDAIRDEIRRHFQQIDRGIRHILRDQRAPLLLAGVEYLMALYREANTYPHLADAAIGGNPDLLRPEDLLSHAWPLVAADFETVSAALDHFCQLYATHPALASSYLRAIVPAAHAGRVEALFVASGRQQWGVFIPATGELSPHDERQPNDVELINAAAVYTLASDGAVYIVAPDQIPNGAPLAASFRYSG